MEEDARRKGHRDNPVSVDVDQGQPIATLQGRRAEAVLAWFPSRPPDERGQGAVVVLERSRTYAAAMQEVWGDRGHVIDRGPVVKPAVEARDAVWRSVPKPRDHDDAKALKKRRKRWLQSAAQRNVDAWIARDAWRRRWPQWRATIDGGQGLRQGGDRTDAKPARDALVTLMAPASQSAQAPLRRRAGTLDRWVAPLVRDMRHRSSNGVTEGCNNNMKRLQRMASGRRNAPHRQKRL
jgi:transposase